MSISSIMYFHYLKYYNLRSGMFSKTLPSQTSPKICSILLPVSLTIKVRKIIKDYLKNTHDVCIIQMDTFF